MSLYKNTQGYSAADLVAAFKGQTLGFDDIDVSGGGGVVEMLQGYGGLTWSDGWNVMKPSEVEADNPRSGFFAGTTSGEQVAYNANADRVTISAESFNANSVELSAAWDKELYVQIITYRGDKPLLNTLVSINDHKPTLIDLNAHNITEILFIPGHQSLDKKSGGSGPFIVFDDLKVSNVQSLRSDPLPQHQFFSEAKETIAAGSHLATAHLDFTHHLAIV